MSKQKTTRAKTSRSLPVFIVDTSSTTGDGLSGVTHTSSGLVLEYRRQNQSTWTSVTAVSKTLGTYVSGGIVASGSLAGRYEVDFPDAAFASAAGVEWVELCVRGVANMLPVLIEIELDAVDYQDAAAFGLSRLNATVGSRATPGDIPTVSAIADGVLEESVNDHIGVAHSLAKYISIIKKANTVIDGVVTSATSPSTTSFSSNINYPTGAFKHAVLLFTNAAVINEQNSPLLTYVNPNGVITVEEPFTTAPTVGDEFIIIPTNHVHSIAAIQNGLATSTALAAVATNVTALVTRIPATLFAGITSLANWLGSIAGKTADSTTRSQINATAAGANFNETTDSLEAIRDRGDAAWTSGGGAGGVTNLTIEDRSITLE